MDFLLVAPAAPDAPTAPAANLELGQDELIMVALACRSPCTVACMAQVCVLWQRAATATLVWEALAARYWLGPLAVLGGVSNDSCGMVSCVPVGMADGGVAGGGVANGVAGSGSDLSVVDGTPASSVCAARRVVERMDAALRRVASGQQCFLIVVEQAGKLHLPSAGDEISLHLAPLRLWVLFGGESPVCCISLCCSQASETYEAALEGRPLSAFGFSRMYEEQDLEEDEDDAAPVTSPGPGLLLDATRHQCFWWNTPVAKLRCDMDARSMYEGTAPGTAPVTAPMWCTPPWPISMPPLLRCCRRIEVMKEGHSSLGPSAEWRPTWRPMESWREILLPHPTVDVNVNVNVNVNAPPSLNGPTMLHVVAISERVSVDNSQQHSRSRELQRSCFRVRWLATETDSVVEQPAGTTRTRSKKYG